MGMTTPFPEPDSPQLEPYKVFSRVEIVGMLRGLRESGAMITAFYDDSGSGAVVLLLEVDDAASELVFDVPSDARVTERMLGSREMVFVAFHQQVKLQFRATAATRRLVLSTESHARGPLRSMAKSWPRETSSRGLRRTYENPRAIKTSKAAEVSTSAAGRSKRKLRSVSGTP